MNQINWRLVSTHLILIVGVIFMSLPVWVAFATSTHSAETILRNGLQFWPGTHFFETYYDVLFVEGGVMKSVLGTQMLWNSMILGIGFAVGKVIISMLAAYAIVYFRFRLATPLFWIIFMTLLLPLEVRIIPSYEVMAGLNLLDTHTGLWITNRCRIGAAVDILSQSKLDELGRILDQQALWWQTPTHFDQRRLATNWIG